MDVEYTSHISASFHDKLPNYSKAITRLKYSDQFHFFHFSILSEFQVI